MPATDTTLRRLAAAGPDPALGHRRAANRRDRPEPQHTLRGVRPSRCPADLVGGRRARPPTHEFASLRRRIGRAAPPRLCAPRPTPTSFVRKSLAQGPADPLLLNILARDRAGIVRDRAVNNPNISAATLRHTANDIDSTVRASTAAHPNCEPATIAELAADP